MKTKIAVVLFLMSPMALLAQDLNKYIQEALNHNPDIQAFELKHKRIKEKENEANRIPNTQFRAGYFISEPETRTGPQQFELSATQILPWFGTINARKKYTNAIADMEYENIRIIKKKVALTVTQSYYNLYSIKANIDITEKHIQLLKRYEKWGLTALKVGDVSAVDILNIQIKQNELEAKRQSLKQAFLTTQNAFNNILNRTTHTDIQLPDSIVFPKHQILPNIDLKTHPELIKYDKQFQTIKYSELLNQKEHKPQIGFGIDYINVLERNDLSFNDNGKDILMPMALLSIPLFNKKYKSISIQNRLQQQEIQAKQQNQHNVLKTMLDEALKKQEIARISYTTQENNLKKARHAERILITSYETNILNFNDVLYIQELQLKFQINQIEAIKTYFTEQAIIDYMIDKATTL